MKNMKVLLVTNYKPGHGGISGQVELLDRHLKQDGHKSTIFSTKGTIFNRLLAFTSLLAISKDYDVIHAHGCSGAGMIPIIFSIAAGRKNHKRVIATYHGGGADTFFAKHTSFVKRYLTKTDVNIVLSGYLGKIFDKYKIPYTIIPNIVEFDTTLSCKRQSIRPNFISIRTLSPLYNIECILRSFQIVKISIPQATLTIIGDGPSRKVLEEMTLNLGLKDVTFTGRIPNSHIYSYLNKADVMLSAPRIDNMPVSILEAFNAGLLVISSKVGGVPYMIEDGETGLLFENDNHKMLAQKMLWAIAHQNESIQMIEKAKGKIANYSWDSIKKRLTKIYTNDKN